MTEQTSQQDKVLVLREKLEGSYFDLLLQLTQIEYGEASLTCIVRDKQIAFAGVSRTKKVMFDKSHKE